MLQHEELVDLDYLLQHKAECDLTEHGAGDCSRTPAWHATLPCGDQMLTCETHADMLINGYPGHDFPCQCTDEAHHVEHLIWRKA